MWAKYTWHKGTTLKEKFDDIVAIATGVTDKTLLSTSSNSHAQANTFIDARIPAQWIRHSTTYASVTTATHISVVLRAPWHSSNIETVNSSAINDPLQFKYIHLNVQNNTNTLRFDVAEGATQDLPAVFFNKTTAGSLSQKLVSDTVATMYIYANAQSLMLIDCTALTFTAYPCIVAERNRLSLWDTNAAGYPPVVTQSTNAGNFLSYQIQPRLQNALGVDVVSPQHNNNNLAYGIAFDPFQLRSNRDKNGEDTNMLIPIYISYTPNGFFGGNISELCGIYYTSYELGKWGDELLVDGKTFVIITPNNPTGLAAGTRVALRLT